MAQAELFKQILAFDRAAIRWITAVRCTIGLAACPVVYSLAGHSSYGILASLGSLYAGLASFSGIYQTRLRHMLATAAVVCLQAMMGTAVGGNPWATIACVTIVAVLFSLYAALKPAANILATYAMACTVVFSKVLPVHEDVTRAAIGNGLIVLSGAALQILSLTIFWPLTRLFPERRTVAAVYESLAEFARRLAETNSAEMLNSRPIQEAHETLDPLARYHMLPEQVALRRALSVAEGIRAAMVALSGTPEPDRTRLKEWLVQLEGQLDAAASKIAAGRILDAGLPARPMPPDALQPSSAALLAVIEELFELLTSPAEAVAPTESHSDWKSHLSFRIIALESSPSLRWMAIRHAERVAAAMFVATSIGRFGALPNGYWIALTTCIVLRTDYATTLSRGFARAVGAVAGVLISIAIAGLVERATGAHTAIFLIAGFGIFAVYQASYTAYSTLITIWVLSSLAAAGVPERVAGWYRLEDTVIGAAIAFAAYRLWPTWQSARVREVLCDAASAQARFCERVLLMPELPERRVWERELDATRAIRYEAESVVEAASKEPARAQSPSSVDVKQTLMELERNAARLLSVLAHRLLRPELSTETATEAALAQSTAQILASNLCPVKD